MDSVRTLEKNLVNFYKKWPHLPNEITKFLADFAWLFALIAAILSALSILSVLGFVLLGSALFISVAGVPGAVIGGLAATAVIISLLFSIVILYLEAVAVNPLRAKQKKGWDYIYYALIVSAISIIVSTILNINFAGLIVSVVWIVISGYVLFEVRDKFAASRVTEKEKEAKKAKLASK